MDSRFLPRSEWPEADSAMWTALCWTGSVLDDAGAFAHLRPA
jgi:hypothetical protein